MTDRTYNYRFLADAPPFKAGHVATPEQIVAGGLTVADLWGKGTIAVTGEAPTPQEVPDAAGHQPE